MNIHTATLPLIFTQQYVSFALVLARLCIVIFYSVFCDTHIHAFAIIFFFFSQHFFFNFAVLFIYIFL